MLFIDEVHRFNKSQQDAFLPVVEDGTIVLIGATTENPSFELNAALLSRCQVFVLKRLDDAALETLLARAEDDAGRGLPLDDAARATLKAMADGDGRYVLTMAEQVLAQGATLDSEGLLQVVQRRAPLYDKSDEAHFNLISALHKSVRGSDPDASLYWLARMLDGGEDPIFIARRLVILASEDVGLAGRARQAREGTDDQRERAQPLRSHAITGSHCTTSAATSEGASSNRPSPVSAARM